MSNYGFVFDQSRCIGCNACQMACKDGHNLEPELFRRRACTLEYIDEENRLHVMHYSGSCNHCKEAVCIEKCPEGAMHRQEDGTVSVDKDKCIGCGVCVKACPYGAPKLSKRNGKAEKCDACYDRRLDGKQPLCVEACITHCLKFMDLGELAEEERAAYTDSLPILSDAYMTKPNVLIKERKQTFGVCFEKNMSRVPMFMVNEAKDRKEHR